MAISGKMNCGLAERAIACVCRYSEEGIAAKSHKKTQKKVKLGTASLLLETQKDTSLYFMSFAIFVPSCGDLNKDHSSSPDYSSSSWPDMILR